MAGNLILSVLVPLALGAAMPLESIMNGPNVNMKFTLEQTAIPRKTHWTPAMSIRRTAEKYGVEVPAYINEAAMRDESMPPGETTVAAKSSRNDIQYLITVGVGNHNLSLDLDTGSSDLWVVSTLLPAGQRGLRQASRLYDPQNSRAKTLEGHSWSIRYGDQSRANGRVFIDKVTLGSLTVPNQAVEAATNMSRTFLVDGSRDGLFGFGFSKLNTIKPSRQLTWFDNIRPKLASPVFTSSLKRRQTGAFDFGYIDKAKYKGEIHYVPVDNRRGHWGFKVTGMKFGNGPTINANFDAIADTGSSIWYAPKALTDQYWKGVPGASFNQIQGGWVFPCAAKLPDIGVQINGKLVNVPGINLNYRNLNANTCFGGIQRDLPMPFSIFGDTFMKNLFIVHEHKGNSQPRLGFAPLAGV